MKTMGIVFLAVALCLRASAQEAWDGGGADTLWSTPENWADNSAPANPYTGTIYFGNTGMGTNVLDVDRQIRYLVYTNNSLTAMHTLDLDGHTLTVDGYLQVWQYDKPRLKTNCDTHVTITNGAIQLGTAARAADLRVTYQGSITENWYVSTNNFATISVDLLATNWGNLYVGYHASSYYDGTVLEGGLDLSGSTIICEGVSNRIKCANFIVGGSTRDTSCRGRLSLPPVITEIETGNFVVGGNGQGRGWGILDLGNDSQLKSITARTAFWYGAGSDGVISNWPGSVDLYLGTPSTPASFRVGSGQATQVAGIGAALVNSNAVVEGYISDFLVGTSLRYNYGRCTTGYVDFATCAIHTGGESNALHTTELRVGGMHIDASYLSSGRQEPTLLLPASLKKIETGLFQLGAMQNAKGIIDFGENSQLESLTVTNDFYFGYSGGKAYLVNFSTNGVQLSIGKPERPVLYSQGSSRSSTATTAGEADMILTNVIWSAYLQNAEFGVSRYTSTADYYNVAKLDLRESALLAFDVADSMDIGHQFSLTQTKKRATGQVYLPQGQVNIATNLIMGDLIAPSSGLLDLSGTTVTVGGRAELWSTATLNARVRGLSSGLELLSSAADALSVSNGAVINVIFEQDPTDITQPRYSGLAAAGDQAALLRDLHADGRLVWDTTALTERWARKVGIQYDAVRDITYVGFDPRTLGTMMLLR